MRKTLLLAAALPLVTMACSTSNQGTDPGGASTPPASPGAGSSPATPGAGNPTATGGATASVPATTAVQIPPAAGQVEVFLTDAPTDEVKQIVVTVAGVEAHVAGGDGWLTLTSMERTLDLLTLQGGTLASLGAGTLPAGRVSQFRLLLADGGPAFVVTADGVKHPLEVPSGKDQGIKIEANVDLPACASAKVVLDFDGKRSLFVHPRGEKPGDAGAVEGWVLRPVITLRSMEHAAAPCSGSDGGAPGMGKPGEPHGDHGHPDGGHGMRPDGGGMPADPGHQGKGPGDHGRPDAA